jgi:hypothetical protein
MMLAFQAGTFKRALFDDDDAAIPMGSLANNPRRQKRS